MSERAVAVVAMADNGVIGRDNGLPWHLPDDLRRFRSLTIGHTVLMGRRTYESIGRPLPGRRNLVLTRDTGWQATGVETFASVDDAFRAPSGSRLFVIGGGTVYAACWPRIGCVEMTEVHGAFEGDTRLTGFDRGEWRETFRERHEPDARHAHAFSFVTLIRR